MTNYNDGKWHGWNGGDCPVNPETVVDCLCDEDETMYHGLFAWDVDWSTGGAFRVIKEHREPREGWVLTTDIRYDQPDDYEMQVYTHVREVINA